MPENWASTTYFCQVVEAALACFLVLLSFTAPSWGTRFFQHVENAIRRCAERPRISYIGIAAGVVVGRLLLLPAMPVPAPFIHDEFSYILSAETFASGRITNPPNPFWRHFEAVHVLQQPTYTSMYPPGQALFLALGILTTGFMWAGVLLSVALLFTTLFWALRGWCPATWALSITLMAALRWGLSSYWTNSYWGGAVPALGGTLVFGTIPRLAKSARIRSAVVLAIGATLLANTRPYEGLIFGLMSVVVLGVWASRRGSLRQLFSKTVIIPAAAVLTAGAAATLFYNAQVTGSAFVLPYVLDRNEYAMAPLFVWQHLRREPEYSSQSLRDVYVAEVKKYQAARAHAGIPEIIRKLKDIWIFFVGPLLSIPLLACVRCCRPPIDAEICRKRKYIGALLLIFILGMLQTVWFYPHYAAPAFAAFSAMLVFGLKELRRWHWRRRPSGLFLSRAVPIGCVLMTIIPISAYPLGWRLSVWPLQWATGWPPPVQPAALKSKILASGGKALVFIEYGPKHDPSYEWVYNAPDIETEPIVWARKVSPDSDASLIRHFSYRSIWLLKPDKHPMVLMRAPDSVNRSGYWNEFSR